MVILNKKIFSHAPKHPKKIGNLLSEIVLLSKLETKTENQHKLTSNFVMTYIKIGTLHENLLT